MKIVDANVLIYAADRSAPRHDAARRWLETALNGAEPVGIPWVSTLAFIRIATNRRIYPHPLSTTQAFDVANLLLSNPNVVIPEPDSDHARRMATLLEPLGTAGNLVTDAHIAAIAISHDADVVTFDNDFDRFAGVRRLTPDIP